MRATTFIGINFIAAIALVMCFYALKIMSLNREILSALVENSALEASDRELCKQYRKWQAMPEIKGVTTSMDAICEKLGQ